jgi:Fe-S cluster assembly ATPase SufC
MIHRFRIQSFKIIRELELTLDRLTVLVGPNACGKSSVLQAISSLCQMKERTPSAIFGSHLVIQEQTTRDANTPMLFRAEGEAFAIEWCANQASQSSWGPDNGPRLSYESRGERRDYKSFWMSPSTPVEDTKVLPKSELFRFEFDNLAGPAVISEAPVLEPSGRGLATVLGRLQLEYPEIFLRIKEAVISVIASIVNIRLRITNTRDQGKSVPAHEILFDTKSGRSIPAHGMSDGTLRVLALLTAALGQDPPKLILLDDIERGIHPRAMIELVRLLQRTLDELPDLQIVATTHSPDLLDRLQPEQIRLLWTGDDGFTRCVPMNEHPDFDRWRDIMTPGEMWAVFDRSDKGAS